MTTGFERVDMDRYMIYSSSWPQSAVLRCVSIVPHVFAHQYEREVVRGPIVSSSWLAFFFLYALYIMLEANQ